MAKLGVECGVGLTAMGQAQVCYRRPASAAPFVQCSAFLLPAATLAQWVPPFGLFG